MKKFIDISSEEVKIAGHSLSWWRKEYDLPLHISYAPIIRENVRAFWNVFKKYYPNGQIRYAAKASCHPGIFKIMVEEGAGADVASYNETNCALEAGMPARNLDLNGNCKEDFLIEMAIEKDMLIVADSLEELQLIHEIAKKMGKRPEVVLRISGFELGNVTSADVFTAGKWTKFGVPISEVPGFLNSLDEYPNINFLGFHTHIGSQIADVEPYLVVLGKMIEMGRILRKTGRECRIINIGGGYPVCYLGKEEWNRVLQRTKEGCLQAKEGDFSRIFVWNNGTGGFKRGDDGKIDFNVWRDEKFYTDFPKSLMLESIFKSDVIVNGRAMNTVSALKDLGEPTFVVEPGRSIVADSGITLSKVAHTRKIADGHNLVTLEMGITNHGEAFLISINRWMIITDRQLQDPEPFEAFVAGNLCFTGDMISRYKISFRRKPKRGDIVMIYGTGAYDSHFFASNANSFPRPDRILADEKGGITVIKRRDTFREIYSL